MLISAEDELTQASPSSARYRHRLEAHANQEPIHEWANERFLVPEAPAGSCFKLLVVRNPIDRLASAWKDKVLLRQDRMVWRAFRNQLWFVGLKDADSQDGLHKAFGRFLGALRHESVAESNPHWYRQDLLVQGVGEFDLTVVSGDLGGLPTALATWNPELEFVSSVPLPKLHSTEFIHPQLFLNQSLVEEATDLLAPEFTAYSGIVGFSESKQVMLLQGPTLDAQAVEEGLNNIRTRMVEVQTRWSE